MSPSPSSRPVDPARRRRLAVGAVSATAAVAIALTLAITAGAATSARTLTVTRSHLNGPSGRRTEFIVTNSRRVAVYWLTGDTTRHRECTAGNGCFSFWPPVKLARGARLTRAAGIFGRLGHFRRDGFTQVTLNGHPLYTFAPDGGRRGRATGDGIVSFGGTWHVIAAGPSAHRAAATGSASSGSGW